jgi:hypothetical protein
VRYVGVEVVVSEMKVDKSVGILIKWNLLEG